VDPSAILSLEFTQAEFMAIGQSLTIKPFGAIDGIGVHQRLPTFSKGASK